tara:strand:+ start:306 stop:821 length:516 start_codon:yes stop_codon:yes gene_type:complete
MSEFKVITENEKSYHIEPLSDGNYLVNGAEKLFDSKQLKPGKFHLIMNHKSYQVEVINGNASEKEMTIRVNGHDYQMKVEDRFDLLLHQLGMDSLAAAGITELKAPMPGLVLSINVEVGQSIKKDDPLVVLEAMKMENVLKSPSDLVVKSIAVNKGQAVEKNQLLIEFETY